ncbi:MAG: hypothetical protein JWN75_91 [Candidatus Saccharibacteria bacterium]|nr:hypothetical protein [Candidatus Saccharibacteria bacterium]
MLIGLLILAAYTIVAVIHGIVMKRHDTKVKTNDPSPFDEDNDLLIIIFAIFWPIFDMYFIADILNEKDKERQKKASKGD